MVLYFLEFFNKDIKKLTSPHIEVEPKLICKAS